MKKVFFSIAAVAIVGFGVATTIYSCSNDEDGTTNGKHSKITYAGVPVSTFSYTNHKGESVKMLEFENFQAYWETIEALRASVKQHNKTFFNNYALTHTLTDSTILWIDSLDFDPQLPLEEFDNSLGFNNSMRIAFDAYEEEWLAEANAKHINLDASSSPNRVFPVGRIERAVLNVGGEVKIGDSIFKFTNEGLIGLSYFDTAILNKLNSGQLSIKDFSIPLSGNGNCKLSAKDNTILYTIIGTSSNGFIFESHLAVKYQWYVAFSNSFAEIDLYGYKVQNNVSSTKGKVALYQKISNPTQCYEEGCSTQKFFITDTDTETTNSIDVSCSKWWMQGYAHGGTSIRIDYSLVGYTQSYYASW